MQLSGVLIIDLLTFQFFKEEFVIYTNCYFGW